MRYVSSLLCVVSVFGLIACSKSNSTTSNNLSACSGDPYLMKYGCSVDRVQAAAQNGDADAEYALGYMYYYGVNTVRDQDSANLWISRSAAQGQPLAKSALAMIRGKDSSKATQTVAQNQTSAAAVSATAKTPSVSAQLTPNDPKEPVIAATPHSVSAQLTPNDPKEPVIAVTPKKVEATQLASSAKAAATVKHTAEDELKTVSYVTPTSTSASVATGAAFHAVETDDVAQMEGRLMHVASDGYTLQLMGNHNEEVVRDFVKSHHLEGKAAYYYSSFDNSKWYMLVYGQYKTIHQANAAIAKLPPELRKMQPWIKPNKDIKAEIQTRHLIS